MSKLKEKSKIYKVYKNINTSERILQYLLSVIEKQNEEISILKECAITNEKTLEEMNVKINDIYGLANENNYAHIFHDSIKNCEWLKTDLSLSAWAIGYPFAYILFRILEDFKPKKILETGLGQSSKIINDYANNFKDVSYDIVEHDELWIEVFKKNYKSTNTHQEFHLLKSEKKKFKDGYTNKYKDFKKELSGKKFNFISIDGPVGAGMDYSRTDIIDIIPECLEKSFVILLDDVERIGEQRTIYYLQEKLTKNNIEFSCGYLYHGKSHVYICTSMDLEYLCHV